MSVPGHGHRFACPSTWPSDILGALRTQGHVSRGYLGIQLQDLDPDLQRLVRTKERTGRVVLDVLNGEAGEAAGLKRYDVITEVSGKKRGRRRRPRAPDLEPRAPAARSPLTVCATAAAPAPGQAGRGARSRTKTTRTTTPRTGTQDLSRRATPSASSRSELSKHTQHELDIPADRRASW
jgi:serine protease Do